MDTATLNKLLHDNQQENYRFKVGESFNIDLPKIPFTGDTEFVGLSIAGQGTDCIEEKNPGDIGEGVLSPQRISGVAIKKGSKKYIIKLINILTNQEIEAIIPLELNVEVVE